jgi:hypothetical protein
VSQKEQETVMMPAVALPALLSERRAFLGKLLVLLLLVALAFSVFALVTPPEARAEAEGFCSWTVSAAIWGLGAAVVGILAATATSGAWIAGVFLSPQVLRLVAVGMSSWSALQRVVALTVCH